VARGLAILAAIAVSLLAVSGAGGAATQQTPKRGGAVVYGAGREPPCVNPVASDCAVGPGFLENVLEPAFTIGPDFTLRPRLVTTATYTRKPRFTVTVGIHPDARWSDGVPVTAGDFVFTHEAIVEHLPLESQGPHRLVRSVQRVDAKTVRVVLRSPTAEWRDLFSRVMPRHALRGLDLAEIWRDGITNPRTRAPIGNGPFLLQSWERGKQMILVRNPRYWGPHTAYLDRIVVRFCRSCVLPPPAEVLATLRQGDVDMSFTRDPAILSELRAIPGVKVIASRTTGLDHLALRQGPGGHPALKNKLVRRALAYGIDRVAVARTVLGELDPNYPASNSAVFVNTSRYYRPNWDIYSHRPALARRLPEQAGCRRGGGDVIYVCAGERLSLEIVGLAGSTFRVRTLELIQRHLRAIGVDVKLSYAPGSILFGQIFPSGAFDAVEFANFTLYGLGASIYGCGGAANIMGYCQRLATRDLDQSDRVLDAGQRARVLNRADRQLVKDVPIIPLYQTPNLVAYRASIRNVVAASIQELWKAEDWWLAD
jgi:peptide/nickel transport system substrate-binding protein